MTKKRDWHIVKCCSSTDVYGGCSLGQFELKSNFVVSACMARVASDLFIEPFLPILMSQKNLK
jgi:hypothetical protein